MPQATLTFNLPEESAEHSDAINGWKWKSAVDSLQTFLRDKLKYGHDFESADQALASVKVRLFEILDEENLSLDD